jgi:hypothetical protein
LPSWRDSIDKLLVAVPGALTLDAGTILEDADRCTILPPDMPMIDQLVTYLDARPRHSGDIQVRHQAVGCAALCIRWGTYLATLMAAAAPPHPALAGPLSRHQRECSLISDAEMRRRNIEVSANLARLVFIFRERGRFALYDLLAKAHIYLPMPQQSVPKDREAAALIFAALHAGADAAQRGLRPIAEQNADRFLANVLVSHAWRNTTIEDIHAGARPPYPLRPHQRRFTQATERRLLREVSAKLGSALWAFDDLFDPSSRHEALPAWPKTASALASTFYSGWATNWSLEDSSSSVVLDGD